MVFLAALLKLYIKEKTGSRAQSLERVTTLNTQELWRGRAIAYEEQITLALLPGDERYTYLRLTWCGEDAQRSLASLLQALHVSPLVWVHGMIYHVASIMLEHPVWAGVSTWADFLTQREGTRMRFSFATPVLTVPPRKDASVALHFPEPRVLFSRLFQRWQELGGPHLAAESDELIQAAGCVASTYHIQTLEVETPDCLIPGYRGWIEYICRGKQQQAIASLCALARLAAFVGIGYLTAEGMGTTSVAITR